MLFASSVVSAVVAEQGIGSSQCAYLAMLPVCLVLALTAWEQACSTVSRLAWQIQILPKSVSTCAFECCLCMHIKCQVQSTTALQSLHEQAAVGRVIEPLSVPHRLFAQASCSSR